MVRNFLKKLSPIILLVMIFISGMFDFASGAFNEKINYQGKLTDSGNVAVADGAYDVVFKLYTAAGGGAAIWTESWTNAALWTESSITFTNDGCAAGVDKVAYTTATNESSLAAGQYLWNTTKKESAVIQSVDTTNNWVCVYDTPSAWVTTDGATNRVYVKNGLFSVMLGSVSSLSAVDFNQTLYLGVTIGADSEMKPRKAIGAVPAAFEAKKLGGKTWAAPDAIGSGTPAAGSFTTLSAAGLTSVSGGAISLNASSNFNVDIGTGTSTGAITIGNATVSDLALSDAQWNITGLGVATFASLSTGSGAIGGGAGSFTTLTSSGNATLATGSSTTNTFGSGASSVNTIGSATTPGALTLHGATTLDNTFTVSGSNLTSLGGNLTVTGTAWTATPTISGLITATSGFDSNAASTVAGLTVDGNGNLAVSNGTLSVTAPTTTGNAGVITVDSLTTGSGLYISSVSTAGGLSGSSKILNLYRSGTNSNASHTSYGLFSTVSTSGTTSTNVAGYFLATGATNNYAIDARGNVIIGDGTAYGDSRLVIAGTTGNDDAAIIAVKRDGTVNPVFSVFPFDDSVFISAGVYYSNGAWVHNSNDANSQILSMSPAAGMYLFASSNSSVSWNVANGVNLWDAGGVWKSLVQSTATGNSYFTGGNVGIGDTTPDGKLDVEPTGAVTAASYGMNLSNLTTNITTNGINKYGAYITSTGSFTGSTGAATNNFGLYVDTVSGADNNYGAYIADSVGIGTTTPEGKLHVYSGSAGAVTASGNANQLVLENSGTGGMSIITTNNSYGAIYFGDGNNALEGSVQYYHTDNQLQFWTSYTTDSHTTAAMVMTNTGKIGINDMTPDGWLDIEPTGATTAASYGINLNNIATNATTDAINKYGAYITSTGTFTGGAGVATNNYGLYVDTVSGADNNYGAYIAGNTGIGTAAPAYQLELSTDSAAKPSTNTWTIASDERIKKDVKPFSDGLAVIEKINPIWYKYNGLGGFKEDGKENIGVLAQAMEGIAPYTVNRYMAKLHPDDAEETELLNFNSHALTFIMINSIKEQQKQIEELKLALNQNGNLIGADGEAIIASLGQNQSFKDLVASAVKDTLLSLSGTVKAAGEWTFEKITAKKLCADDICVDRDQLKDLLDKNQVQVSPISVPAPSATPAPSSAIGEEIPVLDIGSEVSPTPAATLTPEATLIPINQPVPETFSNTNIRDELAPNTAETTIVPVLTPEQTSVPDSIVTPAVVSDIVQAQEQETARIPDSVPAQSSEPVLEFTSPPTNIIQP